MFEFVKVSPDCYRMSPNYRVVRRPDNKWQPLRGHAMLGEPTTLGEAKMICRADKRKEDTCPSMGMTAAMVRPGDEVLIIEGWRCIDTIKTMGPKVLRWHFVGHDAPYYIGAQAPITVRSAAVAIERR